MSLLASLQKIEVLLDDIRRQLVWIFHVKFSVSPLDVFKLLALSGKQFYFSLTAFTLISPIACLRYMKG